MVLIASVSSAQAGPKQAAYQVVEKWGKAFGDADVDGIASLYAPDALMFGTAGKTVLTKPEQIRIILNSLSLASRALPNSRFGCPCIDDNTVVITRVHIPAKGQTNGSPWPRHLVVAKRGSAWMIVHLHRSPLPTT